MTTILRDNIGWPSPDAMGLKIGAHDGADTFLYSLFRWNADGPLKETWFGGTTTARGVTSMGEVYFLITSGVKKKPIPPKMDWTIIAVKQSTYSWFVNREQKYFWPTYNHYLHQLRERREEGYDARGIPWDSPPDTSGMLVAASDAGHRAIRAVDGLSRINVDIYYSGNPPVEQRIETTFTEGQYNDCDNEIDYWPDADIIYPDLAPTPYPNPRGPAVSGAARPPPPPSSSSFSPSPSCMSVSPHWSLSPSGSVSPRGSTPSMHNDPTQEFLAPASITSSETDQSIARLPSPPTFQMGTTAHGLAAQDPSAPPPATGPTPDDIHHWSQIMTRVQLRQPVSFEEAHDAAEFFAAHPEVATNPVQLLQVFLDNYDYFQSTPVRDAFSKAARVLVRRL